MLHWKLSQCQQLLAGRGDLQNEEKTGKGWGSSR